MPWPDAAQPVRMQRVAVVTPRDAVRDTLVVVAGTGTVELDAPADAPAPGDAGRRLSRLHGRAATPTLRRARPDLEALEQAGDVDLLAGEAELEQRAAAGLVQGEVVAFAGWTPAAQLAELGGRLAPLGAAVAPLPRPAGAEPPTLLRPIGARRAFAPLVDTYGTVRYADIDPTVLAGIAYVLMFGAMFADAGQGALLFLAALFVRRGRPRRFPALRQGWAFLAGAGLASCVFGLLYGEFFGPTGVLPVLWLEPLDQPVQLLLAGVGMGAVLLAGAYGVATVDRWREGGWKAALYASSGLAGGGLFLSLGLLAAGWYWHLGLLLLLGGVVAGLALLLTFVGLLAEAGGGGAGVTQALVELFDIVVRLGSNLVSFARLAAFGLTHAALGLVVWQATTALWGHGWAGAVAAVVAFVVGNVLTFALEGLVAAVQALRLEYYELFSRIFQGEGRPFRPWSVPVVEEAIR